MGIHVQRVRPLPALRARVVCVCLLILLHGMAIVGLLKMERAPADKPQEEAPFQVVFVPEMRSPAPRLAPPELERPAMPQIPVPQVLAVETPPAAITVVRLDLPPAAVSEPASTGPVNVDEVEYQRRVPPRYPVAARRAGVQGVVYLRVLIDVQGRPAEVRVHRSSGSGQLDAAASEAVWKFLFKPHREAGVARSALAIIPVQFSLSTRVANRRLEEANASAYASQVTAP